jgi:hypothetical protein
MGWFPFADEEASEAAAKPAPAPTICRRDIELVLESVLLVIRFSVCREPDQRSNELNVSKKR